MTTLSTKNLTLKIGQLTLCEALNLVIRPGEMWAVLGANGSGKTTLLHTLAGLLPAEQGQIFLNQEAFTQLSNKALAQSLGILFQDYNPPFPQTVWEYCCAGRYPHRAYFQKESAGDKHIVLQALQVMELDKLKQRSVAQLSGGEKRRLAIASLLAQTPDIYLLDEPTNHLDLRHQIQVLKHFRHLVATKSAAVVLSLHDVNLAQQFCNRFLFLFPNGATQQDTIMTSESLTRLYQHPIVMINNASMPFWYAISDF